MKLLVITFFLISASFVQASDGSALQRLDLHSFSDEVREHWLTRSWYHNQTMFGGRHIWTSFSRGDFEQDNYLYRHKRFLMGYDYNQRNWSLGGAVQLHWGDLAKAEDAYVKGQGFAFYGSYTPGAWYGAWSIQTDFSDKYSDERISSNATGGQIEVGRAFSPLGKHFTGIDKLKIVPYAAFSSTRLDVGTNRDLAETALGLRTYAATRASWGTLLGRLDAAWLHNMGDALPDGERDSFRIRAGMDVLEFYATLKVSLDYMLEKTSRSKEEAFMLSVDLRF
jgi:hypothetical protein